MAWDSKSTRRRQNSNAAIKQLQTTASAEIFTPKSSHVSDPALQPFLAPTFDPAAYLNATLPSLSTSTSARTQSQSQDASLTELSTQTQTLLSHLSAHTTRLTTTLTQLTDEILRSGSRLAYEVEVLRGETVGLSEALTDGLSDSISNFVPSGLDIHLARQPSTSSAPRRRSSTITGPKPALEAETKAEAAEQDAGAENAGEAALEPAYITQLRTLTSVRARLDTVIKTFGDAMSWTFPPSELSVSSAFLSVSAPEPSASAPSIEEKGQQVSKALREEIADLLSSGGGNGGDPIDGLEMAAKRVEELKELAKVWRGTAEEKARGRFVEGLAKMVEERHRELLRDAELDGRVASRVEPRREDAKTPDKSGADSKPQGGYGFISQLQKMRSGL